MLIKQIGNVGHPYTLGFVLHVVLLHKGFTIEILESRPSLCKIIKKILTHPPILSQKVKSIKF